MLANKLTLNINKSEFMLFKRRQRSQVAKKSWDNVVPTLQVF